MKHHWQVVITCKDYGRFLGSAIDSVLGSFPPADILITVVDDGSTDDTRAVCEQYHRYGVQALHAQGIGVSRARNLGAWAGNTENLLFLDADDRIGFEYIAEATALLDAGADVAYPDQYMFGQMLQYAPAIPSCDLDLLLEVNTCIVSSAHRRSLFEKLGGFREDIGYYSDWDYWLRAAKGGATFEHCPGLHFFRRMHAGQWSDAVEDRETWLASLAEVQKYHPDLSSLEKVEEWRFRTIETSGAIS